MKHLEGWLPIRVYWQHARPMVDWGYLGDLQFTDPFFDQTVNRALSHPANLLFRHQTSRFNAKNPVSLFEDDTAAKNQKATDDLRALAAQWLDGVYQGLELRRNQQEESNSALPIIHGCAPSSLVPGAFSSPW